jgi:hypothetical protein
VLLSPAALRLRSGSLEPSEGSENPLRIVSHRPTGREPQTGFLITKTRKEENTKNLLRQESQDVPDWMQGSLETPLRGDPKAEPWEHWEALEHKNERAYFCASRVPIFSSDPSKPVSLISVKSVCSAEQNPCQRNVNSFESPEARQAGRTKGQRISGQSCLSCLIKFSVALRAL